jgi:hypothetical protein
MTRRSTQAGAVDAHAQKQQHQDPVLDPQQQETAWPAAGTRIKLRLEDAGFQDDRNMWDGVVYVSHRRIVHTTQPGHVAPVPLYTVTALAQRRHLGRLRRLGVKVLFTYILSLVWQQPVQLVTWRVLAVLIVVCL